MRVTGRTPCALFEGLKALLAAAASIEGTQLPQLLRAQLPSYNVQNVARSRRWHRDPMPEEVLLRELGHAINVDVEDLRSGPKRGTATNRGPGGVGCDGTDR